MAETTLLPHPAEPSGNACDLHRKLALRKLLGEVLSPAESATLSVHLRGCPACGAALRAQEEAHASLVFSVKNAKPNSAFAKNVMAALPVLPAAVPTPAPAQLRVFASAKPAWNWRPAAIAALVAVVLTSGYIASRFSSQTSTATAIRALRGSLQDANGRTVDQIQPGSTYSVIEETVLPVRDDVTLRARVGATFAVAAAETGTDDVSLDLQRGDVYLWGRERTEDRAFRVASDALETSLHQGDFFLSEEDSETPQGVLIVFNGRASVQRGSGHVPLHDGQVFVSLRAGNEFHAEVFSMDEVLLRMAEIQTSPDQLRETRLLYQQRVRGYERELTELKKQLAAETAPERLAELRERARLVKEYHSTHQQKLEAMNVSFPLEQIQRGLKAHLDPASWM